MRESDKQMLANHYLDFYRIAFSILHNKADVEDAVQDALVETMANPFVVNPVNYCTRVVKNNCFKLLKNENYILMEQLPDVPDSSTGLDEERMQALWGYKNMLPERIRIVFDLYYEQGYSRHKIAEMTNTSMPTIKKLFHKGHERLKKMMKEHDNKTNNPKTPSDHTINDKTI